MAETEAIARMADKLATDVFGVFGWERVPPVNQNWPCEDPAHHKQTHPTDVVFRYAHPYRAVEVYLNVDLKSYARGTISKDRIADAIQSLSKATHCANISSPWQERYVKPGEATEIHGLLFVYNHDGAYDADFEQLLGRIRPADLAVPRRQRLYVMGPDRIAYLATVANDIARMQHSLRIDTSRFGYLYPDLVTVRARHDHVKSATVEALTGPLIAAKYERTDSDGPKVLHGLLVYYSRTGRSADEFKYLIDYLFRYQLLHYDEVRLRLPRGASDAVTQFRQAVDDHVAALHNLDEIRERLGRVRVETVTTVVPTFSEIEIGMDDR
ncbi:MAG: hypothetical protein HZB16_15360 [Armatimonadetes bacterium]|nr:hypothetical protein [Armatimonadota bacterium]